MVIDGPRVLRSRWEALGGRLWTGDVSEGLQDVKITGIPLENASAAIRLAGVKRRRVLSEAQREVLVAAGAKGRFKIVAAGAKSPSRPRIDRRRTVAMLIPKKRWGAK